MNETDFQAPPTASVFQPAPPPPPQEGNGLAIASMVLGIVSFVLCGPLCSVPAIILGHISLGKIRRGAMSQEARGFAMAGTILGYINILMVALGLFFVLFMGGLAFLAGGAGHVSPFVYQL